MVRDLSRVAAAASGDGAVAVADGGVGVACWSDTTVAGKKPPMSRLRVRGSGDVFLST